MSSLISLSLDLSKIDKSKIIEGKKGAKYLDFTIAINDETNQYGQNVSAYNNQSKEEREAKAGREYLGNGKVYWTNGIIERAEKSLGEFNKMSTSNSSQDDDSDVPF
jgi:hypothetical protein